MHKPNKHSVAILMLLLFAACIAYIVAPEDVIPDYLGWYGWVDDFFVAIFSLCLLFAAALSILPGWVSFCLFAAPILGLLYIFSPIDLIPDFILFVGQIDDVVVALAGLATSLCGLKEAVKYLVRKDLPEDIVIVQQKRGWLK